ncbi:MAG: TRAM domain-containing protein [Patescibacteria group bacterium]|nr:TRAM domain-containing protein [Patescibacteria group bacterium]
MVKKIENLSKSSKQKEIKKPQKGGRPPVYSPMIIAAIAEEVVKRLPGIRRRPNTKKSKHKDNKKIERAAFLDTSAIIDGRIFGVTTLGLITGAVVVLDSVLLELKHIADSQDTVKRERGRNGLEFLEKLKKNKKVKVVTLSKEEEKNYSKDDIKEVDEILIRIAKNSKGKILTCDYNLAKKANIQGVIAVNVNELANVLKVRAVPGEALHVSVLHHGKDPTQGVGYLDDGTMIVVENASTEVGKTIDVVVVRVIQTTAGRILFAKKI